MLFSPLISIVLLSLSSIASARPSSDPSAIAKRASTAQVTSVFTTLKASTDSILPQIDALSSSGTASDATVVPLLTELVASVTAASTSLNALPPAGILGLKRQTLADVEALIEAIITEIEGTIGGLPSGGLPDTGALLASLDVVLAEVLNTVAAVLAGATTLVTVLLSSLIAGGI